MTTKSVLLIGANGTLGAKTLGRPRRSQVIQAQRPQESRFPGDQESRMRQTRCRPSRSTMTIGLLSVCWRAKMRHRAL
ncbi:hypothetical protein CH063_08270 [Colletotrichum higginsianum]|uniref:Uncharacterized protein n=1 Tax=Colletotrichum higginsianum (strain IMI 349063) TaxID=759273 RepID=H1V984_COLHI|nr:hypothetical protein CH063_08270 [Colletotrichum higginsianum]